MAAHFIGNDRRKGRLLITFVGGWGSKMIRFSVNFNQSEFLLSIFRPLHLAAPLGMIDVVETLLTKGASITAVDSKGVSPPLACAANEDVAMCLAMILSVFLATPANSKARRSICSLSK